VRVVLSMFAAVAGGVSGALIGPHRGPNRRAVRSDPNRVRMADQVAGDGVKTARRSALESSDESG
jgi:hypothetical protein